jgi:hypothetical protein
MELLQLVQRDPMKRVVRYGDNIVIVPASGNTPTHALVHGEVEYAGQVSDVRTAVTLRKGRTRGEDELEFSTGLGQLPRNEISAALAQELTHRVRPTVVTFDGDTPGSVDAVGVTRKPVNYMNRKTFQSELRLHAETQAIVRPILEESRRYESLDPQVPFSQVMDLACDLVDQELRRQNLSSFPPPKYSPKLLPSSE